MLVKMNTFIENPSYILGGTGQRKISRHCGTYDRCTVQLCLRYYPSEKMKSVRLEDLYFSQGNAGIHNELIILGIVKIVCCLFIIVG